MMKNSNAGLLDSRLHCPKCGDIVFKKLPGSSRIECTNCGHQMTKVEK